MPFTNKTENAKMTRNSGKTRICEEHSVELLTV